MKRVIRTVIQLPFKALVRMTEAQLETNLKARLVENDEEIAEFNYWLDRAAGQELFLEVCATLHSPLVEAGDTDEVKQSVINHR